MEIEQIRYKCGIRKIFEKVFELKFSCLFLYNFLKARLCIFVKGLRLESILVDIRFFVDLEVDF